MENKDIATAFIQSFGEQLKYIYYQAVESWFEYSEMEGWLKVSEKVLTNSIVRFMLETGNAGEISQQKAGNILLIIRVFLTVDYTAKGLDPTFWIEDTETGLQCLSAEGWVSTQNCLLHVPTVAKALFNKVEIPDSGYKQLSANLFTIGRIPCNFNPNAECPRWLQFLEECCKIDQDELKSAFGLSLTYDRKYNVFFQLLGKGGSGKSTALEVLQELNAGQVCNVSLASFGEEFKTFLLMENRVNINNDLPIFYESDISAEKREAVLKSSCCGEVGEKNQKYLQPTQGRYTALNVFGANNPPRFKDSSGAIRDRLRIIQFPNVYRGTNKQDIHLKSKLFAELPGILNWALSGYGELLELQLITIPESQQANALKREAELACNPIQRFCEEYLIQDAEGTVRTQKLYDRFKQYCYDTGIKNVPGMNRFITEIRQLYSLGETQRTTDSNTRKQYSYLTGIKMFE